MKIAYILQLDISYESGVLKKVLSQIKEWKRTNEVELLIITPFNNERYDNCIQFTSNLSFLKGRVINYLNRILNARKVYNHLLNIKPDMVYIRQSMWYPGLDKILRDFNSVLELNTVDINEIKLGNKMHQILYIFGRKKIINSVKGFVSVSYEIEELYKKYNKPIITIANGYDISQIPKFEKTINKRKQVIFVGSPNQAWHGVEKIVYLAEKLKEFDFHIVGPILSLSKKLDNLILHGYLAKKDLFELYKKMDVGIGTLSLYKKGMQEASPLKVREYIAFKLPVILGYKDTDLEGREYALDIGNYENNVKDNIDQIGEFIQKADVFCKKINPNIISYEFKEKERLEFFRKFLQ